MIMRPLSSVEDEPHHAQAVEMTECMEALSMPRLPRGCMGEALGGGLNLMTSRARPRVTGAIRCQACRCQCAS